mgnify:CR=1 FL=1
MPERLTSDAIRALDGPALTRLAWELGLASPGYVLIQPGEYVGVDLPHYNVWRPHVTLAQADAVFRSLREHGMTTSVVWFGDARHYGEAWVCIEGLRAVSVKWPTDVPTEAQALLLASVLAIVSEKGSPDVT